MREPDHRVTRKGAYIVRSIDGRSRLPEKPAAMRDDDGLNMARGVFLGTLIGVALWVAVILCALAL